MPHPSKRSDEPDFSTVLKFTGQQYVEIYGTNKRFRSTTNPPQKIPESVVDLLPFDFAHIHPRSAIELAVFEISDVIALLVAVSTIAITTDIVAFSIIESISKLASFVETSAVVNLFTLVATYDFSLAIV